MNSEKLTYLEGLRGISCMIVIFDHCVNEFMPGFRHMGSDGAIGTLKDIIAMSPLNIIYSGLTPVFIFFALSGYVLSYKFHETGNVKYAFNGAVKRYFRLVGPVLFSMLFMYIIYHCAAKYTGKNLDISILDVIHESFIKIFFVGGALHNGPLWTMKTELIGSFIIFALMVVTNFSKYRIFTYVAVMYYFYDSNLILFVYGMFLCDVYTTGYLKNFLDVKSKPVLLFLLFIAIYFISYPTVRNHVEVAGIYKLLYINMPGGEDSRFRLWHVSGVFILFYCVVNLDILKSFFSKKISLMLGKYSFSAYVLHYPIIVFLREMDITGDRTPESLLVLSALVYALTLLLSLPFEKYIDRKSVKASNAICKAFSYSVKAIASQLRAEGMRRS